MFNLSSLAENYLSYLRYKEDYFVDKRLLLYELNERELNRLFEKNMKTVSKRLESEKIKDADYFYNMYNIEYENLFFLGRTKLDKTEAIVKKSDVEDMLRHLTCFYLVHSMTHYTYFLNIMKLYDFTFNTEQFQHILQILNTENYLDEPIVALSYNTLMLFLKEDDKSYFYNTKELLDKCENDFNRLQLNNAYLNLRNYCKRMILKGNENFLKELFDIYKIDIRKKTYSLLNDMSFRYYTDVVETALKLKEYRWVKDFIEDYKHALPEDSQENTYLYATALCEFSLKNYEESLGLLSKVKYYDVYHKLKYRALLTMLYYELDYGDLLLSHLDSFNHFLINDTLITAERKEYYSNFIKYVRNMDGLRDKNHEQTLRNLKMKIKDETKVYNKEWLLEKTGEI